MADPTNTITTTLYEIDPVILKREKVQETDPTQPLLQISNYLSPVQASPAGWYIKIEDYTDITEVVMKKDPETP